MNQVKKYFHRGDNVSTAVESGTVRIFPPRWKCFHLGDNYFHRGDNYFHRCGKSCDIFASPSLSRQDAFTA